MKYNGMTVTKVDYYDIEPFAGEDKQYIAYTIEPFGGEDNQYIAYALHRSIWREFCRQHVFGFKDVYVVRLEDHQTTPLRRNTFYVEISGSIRSYFGINPEGETQNRRIV